MMSAGIMLMIGGIAQVLVASYFLNDRPEPKRVDRYARSAILVAPMQLIVGLSAIVLGLMMLVVRN